MTHTGNEGRHHHSIQTIIIRPSMRTAHRRLRSPYAPNPKTDRQARLQVMSGAAACARPGGRQQRWRRQRQAAAFGTRGRTLGLAACVALALCCLYRTTSPLGSPSFSLLPVASAAVQQQQVEEQQQVPVFEATKEWQVIPEGAAIPPVSG